MRLASVVVLVLLLASTPFGAVCAANDDTIRKILEQQVAAWNRGDLKEFVSSYADHCTLVGADVSETTRQQVLEHYQQKYPSPAARGTLAFSGLTVHLLDAHVATVTGHWRLDRQASNGGPVGGVFSLVFELLHGNWQIALDHTS